MPVVLKDLKNSEKVLISQRHGKGEFSKIKGGICNIIIELTNICDILPSPVVSNVLIVVKL